jgi:hypothetical protein
MMTSELSVLENRLNQALEDLRAQQDAALQIDDLPARRAMLALLSNSLRIFCWLEAQRRALKTK